LLLQLTFSISSFFPQGFQHARFPPPRGLKHFPLRSSDSPVFVHFFTATRSTPSLPPLVLVLFSIHFFPCVGPSVDPKRCIPLFLPGTFPIGSFFFLATFSLSPLFVCFRDIVFGPRPPAPLFTARELFFSPSIVVRYFWALLSILVLVEFPRFLPGHWYTSMPPDLVFSAWIFAQGFIFFPRFPWSLPFRPAAIRTFAPPHLHRFPEDTPVLFGTFSLLDPLIVILRCPSLLSSELCSHFYFFESLSVYFLCRTPFQLACVCARPAFLFPFTSLVLTFPPPQFVRFFFWFLQLILLLVSLFFFTFPKAPHSDFFSFQPLMPWLFFFSTESMRPRGPFFLFFFQRCETFPSR